MRAERGSPAHPVRHLNRYWRGLQILGELVEGRAASAHHPVTLSEAKGLSATLTGIGADSESSESLPTGSPRASHRPGHSDHPFFLSFRAKSFHVGRTKPRNLMPHTTSYPTLETPHTVVASPSAEGRLVGATKQSGGVGRVELHREHGVPVLLAA